MSRPFPPISTAFVLDAASALRTMQIITAAIAGGALLFLLVVLSIPAPPPHLAAADDLPLISTLAAGAFVVCMAAALIAPGWIVDRMIRSQVAQAIGPANSGGQKLTAEKRRSLVGSFLMTRQTGQIIRLAIWEVPCFLASVAYMLEHQNWVLVVPVVCILAMLVTFPTRGRLDEWLDWQLRRAAQSAG